MKFHHKIDSLVFTLLVFVLLSILAIKPSFAEENATLNEIINGFDEKESSGDILDEVMEGFEDEADTDTEAPEKEHKPSLFSIDGYVKLGLSYNLISHTPEGVETDWGGLSRMRAELQIDLDTKFSSSWQARIGGKGSYDFVYAIKGRDEFTDDVLDSCEKEVELREAYVLGSLLNNLDIKVGRQIVVWGKSDNIRVTDVLNPLDMREPGITDIEDLRLPVAMTRLDYYIGDWSLTGIALHEIRFNKTPEYGSDFYPMAIPPPDEDKPEHGGENTEFAMAVNGVFKGWDIAFYGADLYNDMPHMETISGVFPPQFELKHARLKMFGAAFNVAAGNWLLKTEAALFDGIKFFNTTDKTYSRRDILAGIEYSGFKDMIISIEAVNRHINDFNDILKSTPDEAKEDKFESLIRITKNFLNETLTLNILTSRFDTTGRDGAFQRFSAEYDVTDAVDITGGAVFYDSGDLVEFRNIGDNDRLFLEVKYSF